MGTFIHRDNQTQIYFIPTNLQTLNITLFWKSLGHLNLIESEDNEEYHGRIGQELNIYMLGRSYKLWKEKNPSNKHNSK